MVCTRKHRKNFAVNVECIAIYIMTYACIFCTNVYSRNPAYMHWREDFEKLGLTKDIVSILHRQYSTLKKKGQGGINLDYMLNQFNVPISEACRAVYFVNKHQKNKSLVDFRTFVLCTWNLCTQPQNTIGIFASLYRYSILCDICTYR